MKNKAFTLVELMVVIAIIAILAVGSITTYSSYLQKSRNSQVIQQMREYVNAFRLYKLENGGYPSTPNNVVYCMGEGYPGGRCWSGGGVSNVNINNALRTYMDSLPIFETVTEALSTTFTGAVFWRRDFVIEGELYPSEFILAYFLEGVDQDCGLPQLRHRVSGGAGVYSGGNPVIDFVERNRDPNYAGSGNTYCNTGLIRFGE